MQIFHAIYNTKNVFKNQVKCIAFKYFYDHKPQINFYIFRQDFKVSKGLYNDDKLRIMRLDKDNGL